MNRFRGLLAGFCAFAALGTLPWTIALGEAPVTEVVPVASPAAAVSPPASPTALPDAMTSSPAPAVTGTIPPLNEKAPVPSGTAPAASGTAAMTTGTAAMSGTSMAAAPAPRPPSPYSVELDLGAQRAYLLKNGRKIAESPISSGREGHLTPTGNFEVIQKDPNHFSNLYGKFVETESGRVVKSGADSSMPVPKGCKFVPAPMKWFMRFDGATGMHAGILPGYAASHGCVRMPVSKAELFYSMVEVGTPVHVFGTAPVRELHEAAPPQHTVAAVPKAAPVPTATPKRKPTHGMWWL